jgi:hypothetical protein
MVDVSLFSTSMHYFFSSVTLISLDVLDEVKTILFRSLSHRLEKRNPTAQVVRVRSYARVVTKMWASRLGQKTGVVACTEHSGDMLGLDIQC